MAVIKTKTKFTKSKFTKNKYSTKKKNVSRMTKKKNVMKGGAKGKPPVRGKSGKSLGRSGSRSRRGRGRTHTFPPTPPPRDPPQYLKIFPQTSFPKKFSNSKSTEEYFLGEGEKLNTGNRSARINIGKLQEQLEKTKNPTKTQKIIFNTLSGKYEQAFVEKVAKNTNMLKKILEAAKKKKNEGGLYMELGSPPPPRTYSPQMEAFRAQGYNPVTGYKKGINYRQ